MGTVMSIAERIAKFKSGLYTEESRPHWEAFIEAYEGVGAVVKEGDARRKSGAIDLEPRRRPGFAVGDHQQEQALPVAISRLREAAFNLVFKAPSAAEHPEVRKYAEGHIKAVVPDHYAVMSEIHKNTPPET